jgi:hypothetical protein
MFYNEILEIVQLGIPTITFFFFLVGLEIELRALAKQVLYSLSPFCSAYIGDGDLMNYLPRLASNLNPLNVSLPSS